MSLAESRRAGERSEGAAIDLLPWLRYVSDDIAEHYDAIAREDAGDVLEGDRIEIKSAAVVLADGSFGRFYLRQVQHERLEDDDGWYLYLVCTPNNDREILAYSLVKASNVEIENRWDGGEDRADYRQISWPDIIDRDQVEGPT